MANITQITAGAIVAKSVKGNDEALSWGMLSKSVAGNSNVTLSATEYSNQTIDLTGVLTGSIDVVFPLVSGARWTVRNSTTGAFFVRLIGASGTGVSIQRGAALTIWSDGTNIYKALAKGVREWDFATVTADGTATGISTSWETAWSEALPAGLLNAAGKVFDIRVYGLLTRSAAGPTLAVRVSLGGVSLAETMALAAASPGAQTNHAFVLRATGTVRTAGATGVLRTAGEVTNSNAGGSSKVLAALALPAPTTLTGGSSSDSSAVDLTTALTLKVETLLSAATASNTLVVTGVEGGIA